MLFLKDQALSLALSSNINTGGDKKRGLIDGRRGADHGICQAALCKQRREKNLLLYWNAVLIWGKKEIGLLK